MTFGPNEPIAKDILSVSQPKLQTNSSQLNTVFSVDHVALDDAGANKGKHKKLTFVEQADDPETLADEYALFAKETAGSAEVWARPESNGTAYQLTKAGNLYLGIIPFVAVNFDNDGMVQGSSIGLDAGTPITTGATGEFTLNFNAAVTTVLAGSADYFWNISGFRNSDNLCFGQVENTATYSNSATDTFLKIKFVSQNNNGVNITRASVILWRFQ